MNGFLTKTFLTWLAVSCGCGHRHKRREFPCLAPAQLALMLAVNALASNALYRYRNVVLRNCNALFDFQMTLFYVLDNLVFAVS